MLYPYLTNRTHRTIRQSGIASAFEIVPSIPTTYLSQAVDLATRAFEEGDEQETDVNANVASRSSRSCALRQRLGAPITRATEIQAPRSLSRWTRADHVTVVGAQALEMGVAVAGIRASGSRCNRSRSACTFRKSCSTRVSRIWPRTRNRITGRTICSTKHCASIQSITMSIAITRCASCDAFIRPA